MNKAFKKKGKLSFEKAYPKVIDKGNWIMQMERAVIAMRDFETMDKFIKSTSSISI